MSVDDFLPAVLRLERALLRAAYLTTQEDTSPKVYITSEFRRSSFEFHLTLEQIVSATIALLQSDNARTASEVVSKVFSSASSALDLLKKLGGAKKEQIQRTTLSEGSIQYNVTINGHHNTFIASPDASRMEQDVPFRQALESVVEPLKAWYR
jgi:hypothetical protein